MIKAYKGFKKDMTCRDFQFEEGKEYVYDGVVEVCESGFHACERPLDCFDYYSPAESVYHEVELSDDISKSSDDTKVAAKKIKIGARLDIAGMANAQFEYVKKHTTSDCADPEAASAGSWGAAVSRGTSEVGENGIACARGNNCKVKGGMGAVLVIAEENGDDYDIISWKAFMIDGEKYKPDTWYCLKDGELVEQ